MWSLLGFRPRLAPDGIQQAQRLLSDPLNSQWDDWKRLFYGNDYLWPQRDGFSPPVIEALLVLIRSHMGDALRSEPVLSKADQSAREQFEWHRSSISSAASRYRRGEVGGDFAVPQDSSLALEWALQQLRSAEEHVEQRRYKLLGAAAHIVQAALSRR